ncbi:hypothetical protein FB565_006940 [Actinoplanes lutulentus]|uniref:DUF3618 domain-containing protein n=1 Tax=Actinoplanes lutulentus TaxID=1287878 RepID=A0A327Z9Q9_9ACTN|nr:hypothetical protein [Actinoplanes lutulentus]MBB2947172.1 hypothetical protein [Actinoplanes lutulentus]RAK36447.1 hypothetical protein B0I29_10836 [Actinoplanes lutulentus]
MSDRTIGAYSPDLSAPDDTSKAKQATAQAAVDVKDTAKEQAQRLGTEAKTQARTVAADVRNKVSEQARTQNDNLVSSIRQTAGHLDEMRGARQDSPAAAVVSRVADGGRQLADYLDRNGPEGVLREVQDFARRRPGAFLATTLAAGFVIGRLGKSVAKADPNAGSSGTGNGFVAAEPQTYAAPAPAPVSNGVSGTEYAAAGTGVPVVNNDPFGYQDPESRP